MPPGAAPTHLTPARTLKPEPSGLHRDGDLCSVPGLSLHSALTPCTAAPGLGQGRAHSSGSGPVCEVSTRGTQHDAGPPSLPYRAASVRSTKVPPVRPRGPEKSAVTMGYGNCSRAAAGAADACVVTTRPLDTLSQHCSSTEASRGQAARGEHP